jgi:protein-S-isoprenylcysteine O-methyltransferase Ste14
MNLIESLELRPLFRRALPRAYGLCCYALAGAAVPYLLCFAAGWLVPVTVDSGEPGNAALSIAVDLALLALFGLQHSWMARSSTKKFLSRFLPAELERSTYVLFTSLALIALFLLWRPLPATVWHWERARWAAAALFALGAAVVYASAFALDHFRLLGLTQAWFGPPLEEGAAFAASGIYRFVRHPLMTGLLLAFWSTHEMTAGHLLFATGMTAYIFIGTRCEERDLARRFGDRYAAYRAATPAFLPWPTP